ncbi:hypothetical protein AX14_006716, partial [Amanita brunnescens Koide BX004]
MTFPSNLKKYEVLYAGAPPGTGYQLAVFDSTSTRDIMINYLINQLAAYKDGDWYLVPTQDALVNANERAKVLGGFVF